MWLGYSTKVTQLQAWREWRSVVARRKRWECFLFKYLKARVRNVCGRCFKAWRLIAAESRKRLVTTMELKGQLLHLVAQANTFATHTMRELQCVDVLAKDETRRDAASRRVASRCWTFAAVLAVCVASLTFCWY